MTLATAKHQHFAPTNKAGRVDTPYLRARREWDVRMGMTVVQAKSWRLLCVLLCAIVGIELCGIVYLARQPKVVPHIIQVDALGEAVYRGPAGASSQYQPPEEVIRYQLRRWLTLARTVSSDLVLLRNNWMDAYKMLTPAGATLMNELGVGKLAFERAQTETAAIEVVSAVPLTTESWQIDWRETTWDHLGQQLGKPVLWRVMIKIVRQPPRTREQMINNPLGIYIEEFHWDRVQPGQQ